MFSFKSFYKETPHILTISTFTCRNIEDGSLITTTSGSYQTNLTVG